MTPVKKTSRDICEGPLLKTLLLYILPLLFTNCIQMLYNTADTIIAGMLCGSAALAAVGSAGSIVSFLSTFMIGLSTGASVCVAQTVGAKDEEKLKRTIHTLLMISFIGGILVCAAGLLFSKPLLIATDTPKEIMDDTTRYLCYCFVAYPLFIPAIFINGTLLSMGETKKPMIFSFITGSTNVLLNLLFAGPLKMGVIGLALATTISQIFSFALNLWALIGKRGLINLDFKKISFDGVIFKGIMLLGVPTGIQNSVITLSNLIIRATYNSFGVAFLSGYTAAQNVLGIGTTVFGVFIQAASVFAGQNYGAGSFERIKKSLLTCIVFVVVFGGIFGAVTLIFGEQLLSLYIIDSKEALEYGLLTFSCLSVFVFVSNVGNCIAGATRGMGVSLPQLFVSLGGSVVLKLLWIYTVFTLPKFHSPAGLMISDPIIWLLQTIATTLIFVIVYKKVKSQKTK